ncbi:MAG: hypothetical protein M3Q23_06065, partial [Actinomycetota bacterium]|nr:hypothetical protein [Actinomycetota bacterium]
ARRAALDAQVAGLRQEADALAEPFGGEPPDVGALRDAVRRVAELSHRVAELRAERRRLDQETVDLARIEEALAEAEEKLEALAAEAEGLSFDAEEFAQLTAERDDAEGSLEAAQAAERDVQAVLREAEKAVSVLEGRLSEARETERRVGDLRTEARYLERTGMLLDGFRDHLVTRVGPELSREAEILFRDLTNHEYDDLRIDDETLSIQIADGEAYHPIERFSGSETDLANLALRVAISAHLSRVSGADLGMMVLDEVLASLDVERKDLFVQAMGRLSNHFHQLFVITHAEQVKDQFPAAIEVRKVGRRRSQAALV